MKFKELDLNDTESEFKILDLMTGGYVRVWSTPSRIVILDGKTPTKLECITKNNHLFNVFMGDSIDRYEFIKCG